MKSILLVGAGGGMGMAVARALKERGYLVFALDVKGGESEEGIVRIVCDVTSEDSIKAAYAEVSEKTDKLYAVLNFAGIYMLDSLVEMEEDAFKRIFDVNFHGVYLVNKTFLPLLNEGSRILITTSELATLDPLPFTGVYAISKAALDKYAYSLRMELQLLKINVSVLRAGAVDTGMISASTDALDRFCEKTQLYTCNADRFKSIVNSVEARSIKPEKIAKKAFKILKKKKARFAFSINRNPLLCLLNVLPKNAQLWAIRQILK